MNIDDPTGIYIHKACLTAFHIEWMVYIEHLVIETAIVLDPYPDEPGNCLPIMKLRWELDLRIEPFPIDKKDFDAGNLFIDRIKATGKPLM